MNNSAVRFEIRQQASMAREQEGFEQRMQQVEAGLAWQPITDWDYDCWVVKRQTQQMRLPVPAK